MLIVIASVVLSLGRRGLQDFIHDAKRHKGLKQMLTLEEVVGVGPQIFHQHQNHPIILFFVVSIFFYIIPTFPISDPYIIIIVIIIMVIFILIDLVVLALIIVS